MSQHKDRQDAVWPRWTPARVLASIGFFLVAFLVAGMTAFAGIAADDPRGADDARGMRLVMWAIVFSTAALPVVLIAVLRWDRRWLLALLPLIFLGLNRASHLG